MPAATRTRKIKELKTCKICNEDDMMEYGKDTCNDCEKKEREKNKKLLEF